MNQGNNQNNEILDQLVNSWEKYVESGKKMLDDFSNCVKESFNNARETSQRGMSKGMESNMGSSRGSGMEANESKGHFTDGLDFLAKQQSLYMDYMKKNFETFHELKKHMYGCCNNMKDNMQAGMAQSGMERQPHEGMQNHMDGTKGNMKEKTSSFNHKNEEHR